MSDKTASVKGSYAFDTAMPVAARLARLLTPSMNRDNVVIAGSLRRRRDRVGDVDIVVLDTPEFRDAWARLSGAADLFGQVAAPDAGDSAKEILFTGAPPGIDVHKDGPKIKAFLFQEIPCEIYIAADRIEFAMLKLLRTGPRSHNIALVNRAQHRAMRLRHSGLHNERGARLELYSERVIYAVLDLDFVRPAKRDAFSLEGVAA